ncbi:MAG: hypothetical protein LBC11_01350 [Puniceicoccales bacterium]|jgi:hypothetical protein|nr:hypothetical protein [Puniceicoccales bacterium]
MEIRETELLKVAQGIAKAYKKAVARKTDSYAQISFNPAKEDFPAVSLQERIAQTFSKVAAKFTTASITVGREFSDKMFEALFGSETNGKDEFYAKFREEMSKTTESNQTEKAVGVRETFGDNLRENEAFITKARALNKRLLKENICPITDEKPLQIEGEPIPLDRNFIKACKKQATSLSSIMIMCKVNPDSLGDRGVLANPGRYAPKPISCHAKSSYFGFTKGLVPTNPKFSRYKFISDTDACNDAMADVKHSTIAGGVAMHLMVSIDEQDHFVYQGTFSAGGKVYRYQIALKDADAPAEKITAAVKNALKEGDTAHLKCYDDSASSPSGGWNEATFTELANLTFTFNGCEKTLVLGPDKYKIDASASQNSSIKQHYQSERYYVSDYDVFTIAHGQAPLPDPALADDPFPGANRYTFLGTHGGEVADRRDVSTIDAINAELVGYVGGAGSRHRYLSQ